MSANKLNPRQDLTESESDPGWIVTYADLVTLLLVFFVLLFSVSSMDLQKFREIARALQSSFGVQTVSMEALTPDSQEEIEEYEEEFFPEDQDALDEELLWDVQEFVDKKKVGDNIIVLEEKNRITITVEGRAFFYFFHAALRSEALPLLVVFLPLIQTTPQSGVDIKGHTADRPLSTAQFPSNWELSAVRATTVLRYLSSMGVNPNRLTATGYGALLPIAPNDSPENRAKNRRVEFVLEKERG